MSLRLRLFAVFALVAFAVAGPAAAAPLRVLYLTQSAGFQHAPVKPGPDGVAPSEAAMIAIGKETGVFTAQIAQNAAEITPERLKSVDVLVFYTTGVLPIPGTTWTAIQDWVRSGKGGFVGLHSATDTGWLYEGPRDSYTAFIGGKFAGHPWTQGTPVRFATHDLGNPTVAMWGASTDYAEEIYQYSDYDPARVRVLQSLDFSGMPLKRPYSVPVTWVRQIGKGRLFYTNIGHTPSTWDDARYRAQIVEGIKWAAGLTKGDATPDPRRQALWQIRSLLAFGGTPAAEIDAVVGKLGKADDRWLNDIAKRIAAQRNGFPAGNADRTAFDRTYAALVAEVRAKAG
jgi:type 1 glutamine amidotransferase